MVAVAQLPAPQSLSPFWTNYFEILFSVELSFVSMIFYNLPQSQESETLYFA